jgi:hypothetical protein
MQIGPAPEDMGTPFFTNAISSIHLDFLGPWRFCFENPRFQGLDFLGFPWILSSESRLINGLHGIFAEKFFSTLFSWRARVGTGDAPVEGVRKGRIAHPANLPHFPIFSNRLSRERCL